MATKYKAVVVVILSEARLRLGSDSVVRSSAQLFCSAKTGGANAGLASFPSCTGVWKRDLVSTVCANMNYPIQWWWKIVEFRESEAKKSLVSVVNTANDYIYTNCCYR